MIRLIKSSDLSLHVFEGRSVPSYAILSHRWEDGEITLQDLEGRLNQHKPGWIKLRQFCQHAKRNGHEFVWIDTCSIDKTSSAELSEAINSMFNWYRRADRCYAYLSDVPSRGDSDIAEWTTTFKRSGWFTRAWTLSELLAPRQLTFVCRNWEHEIGTRQSLDKEISDITRIPKKILTDGWALKDEFGGSLVTVAQIMSWASSRCSTRVEDTAYSLMGLFRINMPLLYGEGSDAFVRLQFEIMSKYDDNSLFAWKMPLSNNNPGSIRQINRSLDMPDLYPWGGLLAPAIQCFQGCESHFLHLEKFEDGRLFTKTNRGIQVEGLLRRFESNLEGGKRWLLPLNCGRDSLWQQRLAVVLAGDGQFAMRVVNSQGFDSDLVDCHCETERNARNVYEQVRIFVPQPWPGDFDFD